MVDPNAEIRLESLTIRAGSRTLVRDANVTFRPGEISMIIGPSGVGKSVLLKVIAGLIDRQGRDVAFSGQVLWGDRPLEPGTAGVVFQSFALFDELNPGDNIRLAQSGSPNRTEKSADDWLVELRVPADVPTARLSGGQRQRLAIARTLAYNPPIILYDEPTSGLDPATGTQVAELLRDVHRRHDKTSIVVTHDYATLWPIADRIFLLDAAQCQLVEIPPAAWPELSQLVHPIPSLATVARDAVPSARTPAAPIGDRALAVSRRWLEATSDAVVAALVALSSLVPVWSGPRWGLRYLWHYALLIMGPTALLYLFVAGLINGYVTTHFMFQYFPYATYTEPLVIEELLQGLGFALYRIFVPVLATILIAARCGAAVAADIGGRQYGQQLDALVTIGQQPRQLLLTGIMISFLVGAPLLNMVSFVGATWASLVSFVLSHPERGSDFWSFHFHRQLFQMDRWAFDGAGWLAAKTIVCGLGVGAIAYYLGRRPKYSTTDVSRAVTAAILWGTLYVLVVHFLFAQVEFNNLNR